MAVRDATPDRRTVKTTVDLPEKVWRAAKIRAMDERMDLRSVVIAALEAYLRIEHGRDDQDTSIVERRAHTHGRKTP